MADGTKAGGDAPRTLFSLGRSGKRKGRAAQASPLEDYPPRHADERRPTPVWPRSRPTPSSRPTRTVSRRRRRTDADAPADDAPEEIDASEDAASEPCPSCSLPLVAGAMFCGECGTRVTDARRGRPAAVLLDDEVPGEPLPPEAEGSFEVAEPVTGTLEDDDDLVEDDDDGHRRERRVRCLHRGRGRADATSRGATTVEAELAERAEPEAELVEEGARGRAGRGGAEVDVEEDRARGRAGRGRSDAEAELVEEDPEAEAELVEEDADVRPRPVEADADAEVADDDGAVVPIAAAATAGRGRRWPGCDRLGRCRDAGVVHHGRFRRFGWRLEEGRLDRRRRRGRGGRADHRRGRPGERRQERGQEGRSGRRRHPEVDHDHRGTVDHRLDDRHDPGADHRHRDAHHRHLGARLLHELDGRSDHVDRAARRSGPRRRRRRPRRPTCRSPARPTSSPTPRTAITLHNVGGTSTSFLVTWSALKTGVTVSPTTGTVAGQRQRHDPGPRGPGHARQRLPRHHQVERWRHLLQPARAVAVPDRPTTRRPH